MAARYLKSVEGNKDIDINKAESGERGRAPKMVQKPGKSSADIPRTIDSYAHTSDELKAHQTSRSLLQLKTCWPSLHFEEYDAIASKSKKLIYEPIDIEDKITACMDEIPEFVVCDDEYLSMTDVATDFYPKIVLNYRGAPADNYCKYSSHYCPEPATTPEKINLQINEILQNNKATRIYLTQRQLDGYLFWRLQHGGKIKFPHILVEDENNFAGKVATISIIAGIVAILGVGFRHPILSFCRSIPSRLSSPNNNDVPQGITSNSTPPADQSSAIENKKVEQADPSESSTSSSTIIDSVDSTTENTEELEERVEI
jgi:hypothetical protein